MTHHDFISRLAQKSDAKIVLLVLDGVGDIHTTEQAATALESATTPHFDALTRRSALGRIVPVATGVTPGSGPGHLALFGYDPRLPAFDIGRGVLEALGLGIELAPGEVAVRGNFATADAEGNLTDRRAGRISTAECRRLCDRLTPVLAAVEGLQLVITPGEGHRFVLRIGGTSVADALRDTDPQRTGVPPLAPAANDPENADAVSTAARLEKALAAVEAELADEPQANRVLLRGFSRLPQIPDLETLYKLRCGAFAGYPLYRGVAAACGMTVVSCGKQAAEIFDAVAAAWEDFDFFFLHIKQTDAAGEDGDLAAKRDVIEAVDGALPALLERSPGVLAVTGDHSTPAPLRAHSWHPVPLLVNSRVCDVDASERFTETQAVGGSLGTFPSCELMGLLLANAGRLAKFGA